MASRFASLSAGCILLLASAGGSAADDPGWLISFTDAERATILQHGPWPPPAGRDSSNRASGNPAAVALGARLFFDSRLSGTGTISCASCHRPEKGWTDGRRLAAGLADGDRNTPSLFNVRLNRWFGWDGANDNLWAQSFRPMLDAREMGASPAHIASLIRTDAELSCRYRQAFGAAPPANDEALLVDAGKALAAFQETIVSGRTPFDDFRDALERGDTDAARRYPEAAQRGLRIFVGKGNCSLCHFGPNFTHGEFHQIGIPVFRKSGGVDWGRYEGIKRLRASPYNLLGAFNDDPKRAPGTSTRHVALVPQAFEQFRVPSLRNVARTAPYMHNGHLETLADVARHYSTIDPSKLDLTHVTVNPGGPATVTTSALLRPLKLTPQEISYVVAFLQSLTDHEPMGRPGKPGPCH